MHASRGNTKAPRTLLGTALSPAVPAGRGWGGFCVSGAAASCISHAEIQRTLLDESLETVGLPVSARAGACEEQVDPEATADQVNGAEQKVE